MFSTSALEKDSDQNRPGSDSTNIDDGLILVAENDFKLCQSMVDSYFGAFATSFLLKTFYTIGEGVWSVTNSLTKHLEQPKMVEKRMEVH